MVRVYSDWRVLSSWAVSAVRRSPVISQVAAAATMITPSVRAVFWTTESMVIRPEVEMMPGVA